MNKDPAKITLETLNFVNNKVQDPGLTFVIVLTAASLARRMLGLGLDDFYEKLKEADKISEIIFKDIMEDNDD